MQWISRILGFLGESEAERFLKRKGYKILDKNFRCRMGEVDIICEKDGTIVFVEVRRRGPGSIGEPSESINMSKRKRIIRASLFYLKRHGMMDKSIRFDTIGISEKGIEHIEGAFYVDGSVQ